VYALFVYTPGGIKTNIEKAGKMCAAATAEDAKVASIADALLVTPPEQCAADIIRGLRRGHNRIVTGNKSSTMFWLSRLLPNAYPRILSLLG